MATNMESIWNLMGAQGLGFHFMNRFWFFIPFLFQLTPTPLLSFAIFTLLLLTLSFNPNSFIRSNSFFPLMPAKLSFFWFSLVWFGKFDFECKKKEQFRPLFQKDFLFHSFHLFILLIFVSGPQTLNEKSGPKYTQIGYRSLMLHQWIKIGAG